MIHQIPALMFLTGQVPCVLSTTPLSLLGKHPIASTTWVFQPCHMPPSWNLVHFRLVLAVGMCWILHTMLTQCFGASCLQVNERGRPFLNILRTQWNGIPDGWSPLLSLTTWWFPEIRLHVIIHLSGISYQKPSIVFGTPMASWTNGRSRPHRHPRRQRHTGTGSGSSTGSTRCCGARARPGRCSARPGRCSARPGWWDSWDPLVNIQKKTWKITLFDG